MGHDLRHSPILITSIGRPSSGCRPRREGSRSHLRPGRYNHAVEKPPGSRSKLAILWSLYFVQGLPYGFMVTALPVYLRGEGVSLTGIGLASWLAVPWMLKFLWAPLVDRYGGGRLGRRKSWILPLQGLLALVCLAAGFVSPESGLAPLLLLVLAMNFFAATLDIAVDGLAVDLLEPEELGRGNIAQVVGFKVGILTGGGLLVWASAAIGWRGLFIAMAGLIAIVALVTFRYREPASQSGSTDSIRDVLGALRRALFQPHAFWLLLFIASYKAGESMADTMFRPFLVDSGFTSGQIGLWVGTWGMVFSIAGSFFGGTLASRIPIYSALVVTASLRILPLLGLWWLSSGTISETMAIAITGSLEFFSGALTPVVFAFMMSQVDRKIGASHYTLLAAVEVGGKLVAGSMSGKIADSSSYSSVFGIAVLLSVALLFLLAPIRSTASASGTATER